MTCQDDISFNTYDIKQDKDNDKKPQPHRIVRICRAIGNSQTVQNNPICKNTYELAKGFFNVVDSFKNKYKYRPTNRQITIDAINGICSLGPQIKSTSKSFASKILSLIF